MTNHTKKISVILLTAGYGSRLMPLTKILPKCLMPISGHPLLQYWIDYILALKIDRLAMNTHYLNEEVLQFLDANKYRSKVEVFHETKLLGTAGTLKNIYTWANDLPIMVVHADNWIGADLQEFINFHFSNRNHKISLSMMTFSSETPSSCGIVDIDENSIVKNFYEKVDNPPSNLANGAVYIIEPEVMDFIKKNEYVNDFSLQVIPAFLSRIATWHNKNFHRDIGTLPELKKAQDDKSPWSKYLNNNRSEWQKKYLTKTKKIMRFIKLNDTK